jgi:hypothetical protein
MPIIEEKVHALLLAGSTVTDIVADRILPPGNHQNVQRPYIVHFPVSHQSTYTHGGRAGLKQWPFYQVSCFAESHSVARALAVAVEDVLSGNHDGCNFFVRGQSSNFDATVNSPNGVHHVAVDLKVFESL